MDVTVPGEVGLIGAADEQPLEFAVAQHRVIVTHDNDFLSMVKKGDSHFGIAYCHVQSRPIGQMLGELLLIYDCLTPDEMRDHIEFL